MKKKTLLTLFALMAFLMLPVQRVCAEGQVQCMVLTQTDGTVTKFALSDAPVVKYDGDNIVVTCGEQSLTTAMSGIEKWTFENDDLQGIDEAKNAEPQTSFSFGRAEISGLKAGAAIGVYGIDGKALYNVKANGEGQVLVDLGNLPEGVYILRTPNKSYKIKK